jgi:beta-lactamase regulating signal transducer with metallopeptidase domain
MSQFISTISVMSLIVLVLTVFNSMFVKAFPAKIRYLTWMVILAGFVVPFRPVIGSGLISAPTPVLAFRESESQSVTRSATTASENVYASPQQHSYLLLTLIWGTISLLYFSYHIRRYVRFSAMVHRWGTEVTDERILSIFRSALEQIGVADVRVGLKTCNFISSSMLTGFFRPVILLPEKYFDDDELHLIFRHELIHFRRHDLIVKFLCLICASIHWFNPFVHLLCANIQLESEASCDEKVLQNADIKRRLFYGELIIGMIGEKNSAQTDLSTFFYTGKENMKKRLGFIMDERKKTKKMAVMTVFFAAVLTLLSGSVFTFDKEISHVQNFVSITAKEAQDIALSLVGGGVVTKCAVVYEDGGKFYEVEIEGGEMEHEMRVDAVDGSISNYDLEIIVQRDIRVK